MQPVLDLSPREWQALIKELDLTQSCHPVCHWVCRTYSRLRCEQSDDADRVPTRHLVDEQGGAGREIGASAGDAGFAEASKVGKTTAA